MDPFVHPLMPDCALSAATLANGLALGASSSYQPFPASTT